MPRHYQDRWDYIDMKCSTCLTTVVRLRRSIDGIRHVVGRYFTGALRRTVLMNRSRCEMGVPPIARLEAGMVRRECGSMPRLGGT